MPSKILPRRARIAFVLVATLVAAFVDVAVIGVGLRLLGGWF
jgi:hypothetical protein